MDLAGRMEEAGEIEKGNGGAELQWRGSPPVMAYANASNTMDRALDAAARRR
jgi:hypothetical protein